MTSFLFYFFKVIVCSALFAGCYWWTLRNGRFYHWNRFYIVASVALSIFIPLLNIPISASYMVVLTAGDHVVPLATDLSEITTVSLQTETSPIAWIWPGFIFCLSIVFFLLVREVLSFVRILRLKRRSERLCIPEAVLYCTNDAAAPFTFFRTIFWKKGISVDSGEGRCMFRHELAHVRLGHSWDKALMQLVCCLFWMNPFFMLFRRELELVHEFAADSESIGDGNAEELSSLILCTLYPNHYRDFTSRFFQSSIKRRIFMISKNKKTTMCMLRKISIIPIALVAMYLFSFSSESCLGNEPVVQVETAFHTELPKIAAIDAASNTLPEGDDEVILFAIVEVKPMFNGKNADNGFREYVNSRIVYPTKAMEQGISGSVIVEFIIEKDGSLSNVKVIRGTDPLLDNEALRVVKSSPPWTSGKHDGNPVRVKYQFPLVLRLTEQTPAKEMIGTESKTAFEGNNASDDEIYLFADAKVQVKPMFNGKNADNGFREYGESEVVYPKVARDKGIAGRVIVEFVIEKDGSLSNLKFLRRVDPLLDDEVLRVINSSPQWTPGKQDGKPVRVMYQFPFVFRLS